MNRASLKIGIAISATPIFECLEAVPVGAMIAWDILNAFADKFTGDPYWAERRPELYSRPLLGAI